MECCRRIVELSRCLLYCAYHYHCPHRHKLAFQMKSARQLNPCVCVCWRLVQATLSFMSVYSVPRYKQCNSLTTVLSVLIILQVLKPRSI